MSKATKAGTYDHITPQLVKQVEDVLAEAANHRYSISKVYGAYNAVMLKNDKPEACASCLANRSRELSKWLDAYKGVVITAFGGRDGLQFDNKEDAEASKFPAKTYDEFVRLFKLEIGDSAESEAATLDTVITLAAEGTYAFNLFHEEQDMLTARLAELNGTGAALGRFEGKDGVLYNTQDEADASFIEPQYVDDTAPGYVAPAEGVNRVFMAEGLPFDVVFNMNGDQVDTTKGTAKYADGSTIKAGTYKTASGENIAVQPGGKITVKYEDLI